VAALIGVSATVATVSCLWPGHPVYWYSPSRIQRHLIGRTALGSSEREVIVDLERHGIRATVSGFRIDSLSFGSVVEASRRPEIHVVVGSYRTPFRVSVEAFYTFDDSRRLVDIRVRKTSDTP
jgi:hypothetical protein